MNGLDKSLAREIIEKVAVGNPPLFGIEHYTAGLDPFLNVIEKEYLQDFIKNGGASFKALIAGYGGGKTHSLFCIQSLAWKHNYATSYIVLSPTETPFHDPSAVYRALVKNLSLPPDRTDDNYGFAEPTKGIDNLIKDWYYRNKSNFENERQNLKERFNRMPSFEDPIFTKAIRMAFISLVDEDEEKFEELSQWLMGYVNDRKTLNKYGLLKVDKSKAFPMMRSLPQWLTWAGYSGLVIMFDETEQISSFNSKQKELILSNLRQLIDECGNRFKNVLIFYSMPDEEFLNSRGLTYEALKQRLSSIFRYNNPTGVKIRLDDLTNDPKSTYVEIGKKLVHIYEVAYENKFEESKINGAIETIANVCIKRKIASSHKRDFVKSVISALHLLRESPDANIDAKKAEEIVSGASR